ncbi:carbohydrate binding domain-containing protein [Paenibacillus phocaensis]|uniref:carbohydrate binding domain-containing protein n=1 Tax=Paenibacillus phocaensis TaxID=1776378 RepID=UPI000839CA56|nr:carbohydrate binding domain-containing protein [Paenibacillus phocaensis]
MKRLMTIGLILSMMFSSFMIPGYASPTDQTEGSDIRGHWAEASLRQWSDSGILTGYLDGTLRPDEPVTRAEFSALLQRVFGVSGTGRTAFTDVSANAWYASSLAAALQAGYITGYEDGTFKPNRPITRAETAVMLSKAFQLSEIVGGATADVIGTFKDKSAIRTYSLNAVNELVMTGATQGYPDGTFRPEQFVTRSEAVTLLDRLAGKLYNSAATDERKETLTNMVINSDGVILRNKELTGNLYFAPGIGDGDVTVENMAVAGVTFINGGGPNSIHIKNTKLANVVLARQDSPIRVVVDGHTVIQRLILHSPATIQTAEGASIQNLELQIGSSGSIIAGNGSINRITAWEGGIKVNGQELEQGKALAWSPTLGTLVPVDEKKVPERTPASVTITPSPSTDGTAPPRPSEPGSSLAAQGSLPGTTKVTTTVSSGNHLAVLVSNKVISPPQAGSPLLKSHLLTNPYTSGTDISGVDPKINKYLGVYEVDGTDKVVKFQQIALTEANIKPEAWNMVWNDEFEDAQIDPAKWNFIQGGGGYGNEELQNYTNRSENARIENGHLVIEALKEKYQGNDYTSAKLTTQGKGDWTYGKFEVRAQMPRGKGIWPAIWMMPSDEGLYSSWPASGEIDIMELLGHEPNKIYGTLHYGQPHEQSQGSYTLADGASFADGFHTFGVEWEPGEFRYYVDGVLYAKLNNWFSQNPLEGGEYTYPAPFDRDFFLQLNLAVGGKWPGNPDDTTEFSQKMLVDYVRVYEREGLAYRQPVLPAAKSGVVREPGEDGNYVENGSFEKGLNNWVFQPFAPPANLYGGEGTVEVDNGSLKTTISQEGTVNYAIQLVQSGLPVIKGATYRLSFDAWSTGNRTMMASLSGPDRSYTRYMEDKSVSLTDAQKTYSYEFTMNSDTDANARLEFNMGLAGTLPVWVDNVQLMKIKDPDPNAPREPLPSGNLIYNGTFDQGVNRLGFWQMEGPGSADADYYVGSAINDRKLYVKPAATGQPDALLLTQDRLNLAGGKTYILSFSAKADTPVSIATQIGNKEQPNAYADKTYTIGTELQNYSLIFTMDSTDPSVKLHFGLGALTARLELDNVSLKEMSPPVEVKASKRIEAENYSDMQGVQKGDDGLSVGWIDPGDWMQYIIDVKQAGDFKINYFVASGYDGGGSLTLRGKQGSVFTHNLPVGEIREDEADFNFTMDVANTGDWGIFKLVEQTPTVHLGEGIYTLQLYAPHVNVDYFTLTDVNYRANTGNLIRNGTFDAGVTEWQTYQAGDFPEKLSISAADGALRIHLPGIEENTWEQQVYQEGLTLEQGKMYTVTFDVYSTVERPIQLAVGTVGSPPDYEYTDFLNGNKPVIWLTDTMKQHQFSFVMTHPTNTNAKLEFDLGQMTVDGAVYKEPGDIFFDNIRLNSSLLENGAFDESTDHWSLKLGDQWNGMASASLTSTNGELVIRIDTFDEKAIANELNWIPQVSQTGLRLEKGKTYLFSFDARASVARKIDFGFGKSLPDEPYYDSYFGDRASLTTEMQRYTYTFTMGKETEENAQLDLNVGMIEGIGANTEVILDNVVWIELD